MWESSETGLRKVAIVNGRNNIEEKIEMTVDLTVWKEVLTEEDWILWYGHS